MSMKYVIRWKSKVNGRAGKGTKAFEREEAQRLVEELNTEYPDIEHDLLEAPPQPEPEPHHAEHHASRDAPSSGRQIHAFSYR